MNFIKENLFIVMGVTLPLILIGFLAVVQTIQKASISPPTHHVAYLKKTQFYNATVVPKINKNNQKLSITLKSHNGNDLNKNAKLTAYIYHPDMGETPTEYSFDLSKIDIKEKTDYTLPLPKKLKDISFIDKTTSPDGYQYKEGHRNNGNIMSEIFGYSRYSRQSIVEKKGFPIRLPETKGWNNTVFIGWVENE
jgi:hypothetical protein